MSELEQLHRRAESVVVLYRNAIESAAAYAVELEPVVSEAHRRALAALAAEVVPPASLRDLAEVCTGFRNRLREYRDRAAEYLRSLRRELNAKAASLQQICESLTSGSDDHDQRIGKVLQSLRETAYRPEAAPVRSALLETATAIEEDMEIFHRQHQVVVAQFLVEIQMLHERVQQLENDRRREGGALLLPRDELEALVAGVLAGSTEHCLLLLRLRNGVPLRRQFGVGIDGPLAAALCQRLSQMVGTSAVGCRWDVDMLAVLLPGPRSELVPLSKRVGEHVGGNYVCNLEGKLIRPVVQIDSGLIECTPGETLERLVQRLNAFYRLP